MRPALLCSLIVAACASLPAQEKHVHIVTFKCEGKPDRLVGRQDGIYFACIDGKVTCSEDGLIPQSWMDEHDANIARLKAKTAPLKAPVEERRKETQGLSARELYEQSVARMQAERKDRGSSSIAGPRPTPSPRTTSSPSPNPRTSPSVAQVMVVNPPETPTPSKSAPVERASLEALALGVTAEEVIEQIGPPKMKLAGGAGEKWTYQLTTGQSAKLEFAGGRLARVDLP